MSFMQVHQAPGSSEMSVNSPKASGPTLQQYGIGAAGTSRVNSNEKNIVLPFVPMVWDDNSHDLIRSGSIIFACRNVKNSETNMVCIEKFNEILRDGGRNYRSLFGDRTNPTSRDALAGDPIDDEAIRRIDQDTNAEYTTDDFRETISDRISRLEEKAARLNIDVDVIRPSMETVAYVNSKVDIETGHPEEDNDPDEVVHFRQTHPDLVADPNQGRLIIRALFNYDREEVRLYREMLHIFVENRDMAARYGSVDGIVNFWNLLGTCNNTSEGKAQQFLPFGGIMGSGSGQYPSKIINVVIKGRSTTPNIWRDNLTQNSALYLVLTRERLSDDDDESKVKFGDYQVIPWATENDELPPERLLRHRDYNGHPARGHYWRLARVKNINMGTAHDSTRRHAAGLRPTLAAHDPMLTSAFAARAKLETLEIEVKA